MYVTAAAVGKPKARVPYAAISPSCVKGFPKGLKFGPPSSFSTESLRRIVDAAEDIAFTGMQTTFLTIVIIFTTLCIHVGAATLPAHLIEHSYSKQLNEPIKIPPRPKAVYTCKTSTMLSAAGDIKDVYDSLLHSPAVLPKSSSNKIKKPKKPSIGSVVNVIHKGKPVAKAVVMEGTLLHEKKYRVDL